MRFLQNLVPLPFTLVIKIFPPLEKHIETSTAHILILSNVILVAFLAENYLILDNETLMFVTDQIVNKVHRNIIHQGNLLIISITLIHVTRAIQVLQYNSLVVAHQNVPITSVLTNCTLGSWKDFDVDLSLIGSNEMIWKTCFVHC